MYVLINKTLKTIPYKDESLAALCAITLIEFPDDFVEICPVACTKVYDSVVNADLIEYLKGVTGQPVPVNTNRFDIIKKLVEALEQVEATTFDRYKAEYQAKALPDGNVTRYRFDPNGYILNPVPAPGPNLNFVQIAKINGGTSAPYTPPPITTPVKVPVKPSGSPAKPKANPSVNDLVDIWCEENCEILNNSLPLVLITKLQEYLLDQGVAPFAVSFGVERLKKRLQLF